MEYKILKRSGSESTTASKKITLIWGNDGWCYIPQLGIRRKFTDKYLQEEWNGVIAMPEYLEEVNWIVHSSTVWSENDETYELKCPIQKVHKNIQRRQVPHQ